MSQETTLIPGLGPLLSGLDPTLRFLAVLVATVATLFAVRFVLERRFRRAAGFRIPLIMSALSLAGILVVVTFLPIAENLRIQLIRLFGILLSASIALSSTTLLGNALAGVMLRVVGGFRTGDYVRVGEHAGRVSERGLFHTEIQTEDRDLTTLPNLFLVSNPVRVARSSGTIVSANVSLGYDVSRRRVEKLMKAACEKAGLSDPFVEIVELGDFSVVYRAAGLLEDVKQIISARSLIRGCVMDALHEDGIEIVSPTFMTQRRAEKGDRFVPPVAAAPALEPPQAEPERVVFDKAEEAEALDGLKKRLAELEDAIRAAEKELQAATGDDRAASESGLAALRSEHETLSAEVEGVEERAGEA